MKTDELIEHLARNVTPVAPWPKPARRALVWWLGAVVYIVALAAVMTRGGLLASGEARAWLPQAAALVASLVAVHGAFVSVVPGRATSPTVALAVAGLVWLGTLFAASGWAVPAAGIVAAQHEWACVALIAIGGAPLMIVLAAGLRRGAPLSPATTAALVALAAGTLANVGACWSLPHASNESTLVWHGGAVAALVVAGALAGRRFFKWRVTQADGAAG
jgi:hypothetical protein